MNARRLRRMGRRLRFCQVLSPTGLNSWHVERCLPVPRWRRRTPRMPRQLPPIVDGPVLGPTELANEIRHPETAELNCTFP